MTTPLTNLLKKREPYKWSPSCQQAFERVKAILQTAPVLVIPDFGKQFKLVVDASDLGARAVLQQDDDQSIDHPVCNFSTKFNEMADDDVVIHNCYGICQLDSASPFHT